MSNELDLFKTTALATNSLFSQMMEETTKLAGGGGGQSRRISIRGGRFREIVNGEQLRVNSSGSMNVVILRASGINRTYYAGAYDPENPTPPACWSTDSEKPAPEVTDAGRQSANCRTCPMNVRGSGQGESRACRFSVRLAICVEGDYGTIYEMQLPATSIFGEAKNNRMPIQAYARYLKANGLGMAALVTQMYFDEDSETPKLFFKPLRPLDEDELESVLEAYNSDEAQKAVTMTVSLPKEEGTANGSKAYNPKTQGFTIDDEDEPKPAPKAKAAPVEDAEPVAEPTKVAKASSSPATQKLADIASAWGD